MLAQKLDAVPGIGPGLAKGIIVIVFGAVAAGLVALVQDGTITGPLATLAPIIAGAISAIGALVDPNAAH